jgi:hypothetical protein
VGPLLNIPYVDFLAVLFSLGVGSSVGLAGTGTAEPRESPDVGGVAAAFAGSGMGQSPSGECVNFLNEPPEECVCVDLVSCVGLFELDYY